MEKKRAFDKVKHHPVEGPGFVSEEDEVSD